MTVVVTLHSESNLNSLLNGLKRHEKTVKCMEKKKKKEMCAALFMSDCQKKSDEMTEINTSLVLCCLAPSSESLNHCCNQAWKRFDVSVTGCFVFFF